MFAQIVQEIVSKGLSEARIAATVRASCPALKTSQATINRIKNGKQLAVGYELGSALKSLHRDVCGHPEAPPERQVQAAGERAA